MSRQHDYAIGSQQTGGQEPQTLTTAQRLRKWMKARAQEYCDATEGVTSEAPHGKIYVAATIEYQAGTGITQTGSAPGYHSGVWTLCTCKKPMRSYKTIDRQFMSADERGLRRPKHPFFIVVLASSSPNHYGGFPEGTTNQQNWVASISLVTAGFNRMEDCADYIAAECSQSALRHRRTAASDRTDRARDRGDLHVNEDHEVVYPGPEHQHGPDEMEQSNQPCGCSHNHSANDRDPLDHRDNQHDHIKMFAGEGEWLGWTEPAFYYDISGPRTEPNINGTYTDLIDGLVTVS